MPPVFATHSSAKKWHRLYFTLAAFDLLVVLSSLFITHQIVTTYRHSIHTHQTWVGEISEVAKLSISAFNVVAASSGAFDNEDLELQAQLINEAIVAFDQHFLEVNEHINARIQESGDVVPGIEATFEQVRVELTLVNENMENIERDISRMLALLAAGDIREATLLLGPIDDQYIEIMFRINSVRNLLRFIQNELFSKELDEANRLGKIEVALYLFVLLMVAGAVYYGRRLGRELESNAKERERHLQTIEANGQNFKRQATLLDKAHDAMIVTDLNGIITFWNKGAERLYGWTEDEMRGSPAMSFLYSDLDTYATTREQLLEAGAWEGEQQRRARNGDVLIVESSWTLVRDDQGTPQSIFTIDTDITARKQAEAKIYHLAFHDQLTGMPNRQLLEDRLQQSIMLSRRSNHKNALMFIDLDNFKELNDTQGHAMGDLLLREVASRLVGCVRESDTVARFGGDEFVVVINELSHDEADAAARATVVSNKILETLSQPYQVGELGHNSTPSIGVVLFDGATGSVEDLIQRADMAMYRAKAAGRSAIRFYDSAMQSVIKSRVTLEADLKEGMGRNEFTLHYQPQVDQQGRVVGAEGLLRWQHPTRGPIAPATFIHLAEESGVIAQLGRVVLEHACRQLKEWERHPATRELTLSVNVSARQFHRAGFIDDLQRILASTGANAKRLKLEMTESVLLEDMLETTQKMILLKRQGIEFSLDDFGTGYSSLAYLRSLPLSQLKIDRSFIMELPHNSQDGSIVEAITVMGHKLGMQVIAEGVETQAQKEFLAAIGCQFYQGYLFAKPMPAEAFTEGVLRQAWII